MAHGCNASGDPTSVDQCRYPVPVRHPRLALVLTAAVLAATTLLASQVDAGASTNSPPAQQVSTITLKSAKAYQPHAQPGTTDDYHCTLLDPHVTKSSYILSSQFAPGSNEDHHAALFLVPPSIAAIARKNHTIGKGWTCFGEAALPGTTLAQFLQSPFLSIWAPGHGADVLTKGTGIPLPVGSLVIIQVHYNLLIGDKAVKDSLVLHTVPVSKATVPLNLELVLSPPDLPCPAGVTGPLCDRAASVADQGKRFGKNSMDYVNGIEQMCGHDPATAPVSNSTSCDKSITSDGYITRTQAHMHLLATSFSMVLDPGTSQERTVLDIPHYDFHNQLAYNLKKPIAIKKGETVRITCTYDPKLAQELPTLRKAPPHYVTWGDGSTDEMCIGLMWTAKTLPKAA